jgi:hypothetical protein
MKYILVLFFSALVLTGCGDKESAAVIEEKDKYSADTTEIKTEPVENPDEQFQISYKFKQNNPITYRITMLSDVNQQTVMDTTINMQVRQSMTYILQLTPRESDSDGSTELNCLITSSKIEMEGSGQKITYISDSIDTPQEKADFAEHHALINNPFSVRVAKNGEILEFFKVDKLTNSYLEFKNLKDSASAQDKNMLKEQIIQSMLAPLLTQIFRKVPETELAKDSTWSYDQPKRQMMVFTLNQKNKFRIMQLEKFKNNKLAVIGIQLESNVTGDPKVTEEGVNYSFNKPKISAEGTIHFNIDEGFVQKVKTETLFETSVTAESRGTKRSNMEVIKNTNFVEKI